MVKASEGTLRHPVAMRRTYRVRGPVTINREWFGAKEFHPRLQRSLFDNLQRLLGRSLALVP